MDRSMNQQQVFVSILQPSSCLGSPMRRTAVHDPENALGITIGWLCHYLFHQSIKRDNARFGFTAAEQFHTMNI